MMEHIVKSMELKKSMDRTFAPFAGTLRSLRLNSLFYRLSTKDTKKLSPPRLRRLVQRIHLPNLREQFLNPGMHLFRLSND